MILVLFEGLGIRVSETLIKQMILIILKNDVTLLRFRNPYKQMIFDEFEELCDATTFDATTLQKRL